MSYLLRGLRTNLLHLTELEAESAIWEFYEEALQKRGGH